MILIRPEKPEDLAAIYQVNEMAFGRSSEADLVDALRRNGKATLSLVAEHDGRIIGHIMFSPVTIESETGVFAAIGLAPLAVLPQFQNQGVGSLLTKQGIEQCRAAGHSCLVVLGHSEYYPRFGFVPASRYGVKSEYNVRDEVFMLLELQEGAMKGRAGVVKYQAEFDRV